MLDTITKRRIDNARDILVGKVPDPKSQVEQITIALIYKFMDDMDAEAEELGGKRKFFTGDFARYGWAKLMSAGIGGHELIGLYGEGIATMPQNPGIPPLFRDIFKNAYLPYRDPETLKSFLKIIDEFSYDHSERLGDAYEYLLSVLGSQGDAGQFRTPRHIIDFMVEIMDPKKHETITDTCCGTAVFLISAYKHILKHNSKDYRPKTDHKATDEKDVPLELLTMESPLHYKGDLLTPDERKRLAGNIKGYDISPDMVRMSLVNLYLHGFNDPHIFEYDTLTSEERWDEYADVIFANPPFMSPKGGIKPHKRFSIQAKRSEVLFVDYIAEHLTPAGRAAIIVPEGIIFQSQTAYKALRKMLVDHALIAVISLPAGVFQPYSGVKTSILILDKALAKQSGHIAFFKIENDGFGLGAQRRAIAGEQLTQVKEELDTYLNDLRTGEFNEFRAIGPASSQPGATPQEIAPHDTKGLKAHPTSGANDESGFQPPDMSGNHEPGAMPQAGMECAVGSPVTNTTGAPHPSPGHRPGNMNPTGEEGLKARPISEVCLIVPKEKIAANGDYKPGAMPQAGMECAVAAPETSTTGAPHPSPGHRPGNVYPTNEEGLKARPISEVCLIVSKEKIAANGDYNLSGERYRESGARNSSFPLRKFEEVCTLEYGASLPKDARIDGPYPVVGSNGITGRHNQYLIEGPAIVVGRKGSAGEVTMIEENCFPIDTTYYVKQTKPEESNLTYLYWILKSLNLPELKGGAGIPGLNRSDVYNAHQIPLPPLEVQKAIVAEIEGYQKVISGARAVLDNYRPHIPIHPDWPLVAIEDLVSNERHSMKAGPFGSALKKEFYVPSGYKIYGQEQVIRGDAKFGDYYISEEKYRELESCKIKAGDILISLVGTYGKTLIVPDDHDPGIINPRLLKLTLNPEKMIPAFFVTAFAQESVMSQVHGMSYGGTMDILSMKVLKNLRLPLPPLATQQEIVAEIEAEQVLVAANRELITRFEKKIQATLARVWAEVWGEENETP